MHILKSTDFVVGGADFGRTLHQLIVPTGCTIDDILTPLAWRNVSGNYRRQDRIECFPEDGDHSMVMTLVVMGASNGFVRVYVESGFHAGKASYSAVPVVIAGEEYPCAKWGGPEHKFRVLGLDKQPAKDQLGKPMIGYATKEEAEAALGMFKARAGIRNLPPIVEEPKQVELPRPSGPLSPAKLTAEEKAKKFDAELRALGRQAQAG